MTPTAAQTTLLADLGPIVALSAIGLGLAILGVIAWRSRRPNVPPPAKTDDYRALIDDMHELADRLAKDLDARSRRLETLLAEADARANRLAQPPRTQPTTTPPITAPAPLIDAIRGPTPVEPAHQRIHELADQGLTPVAIAQATGTPTGQVELVLALRRAAQRAAAH